MSGFVEIVHELPLLLNIGASEKFYTIRERCDMLTGYLSLGLQPGGDWANT